MTAPAIAVLATQEVRTQAVRATATYPRTPPLGPSNASMRYFRVAALLASPINVTEVSAAPLAAGGQVVSIVVPRELAEPCVEDGGAWRRSSVRVPRVFGEGERKPLVHQHLSGGNERTRDRLIRVLGVQRQNRVRLRVTAAIRRRRESGRLRGVLDAVSAYERGQWDALLDVAR
jgi:hypothetical protein